MKTAHLPLNLRFFRTSRRRVFMAVALAALLGTAVASAQTAPSASHPATAVASAQPQAATKPAQNNEKETSEAKPDEASHQGIKVHGHWKIDIKNPDGSLASTHEFENSLNGLTGAALLADLLSGQMVPGGAGILLTQVPGTISPCNGTADDECFLFTGAAGQNFGICKPAGSNDCSSNLTIQIATDKTYGTFSGLVLSGSVVATQNGNIGQVVTNFITCNLKSEPLPFLINNAGNGYTGASPQACSAGTATNLNYVYIGAFPLPLTSTTISTINVLSGQTIQVTVTLSFS